MKFLIGYIRERSRVMVMFLLCAAIYAVSFALYRLPAGAVLYPSALCAVTLLIFAVADCLETYFRHRELVKMSSLPDDIIEKLSRRGGLINSDYCNIIRLQNERECALVSQMSGKMSDIMDYYTTWVHQIKIPISSMKLTLQNEDTAVSRKLTDDLFRVEQYVSMALNYLRIDSSTTDYVFREYDLDEIVCGVIRKFSSQFIGKGIRLFFVPSKLKIITDEKWLSFVVEQIISNALKYTPEGGSVTVKSVFPEILCIIDTGIGIVPEDLPRVFEKSYTGYNGRDDKLASGIGLYLCRRVCDKLGHEISIASEVGSGTEVRLSLGRRNVL